MGYTVTPKHRFTKYKRNLLNLSLDIIALTPISGRTHILGDINHFIRTHATTTKLRTYFIILLYKGYDVARIRGKFIYYRSGYPTAELLVIDHHVTSDRKYYVHCLVSYYVSQMANRGIILKDTTLLELQLHCHIM